MPTEKIKNTKLAVPARVAKLLRKVEAHILEEPRRLDMNIIAIKSTIPYEELDKTDQKHNPPCGTVACIAGWTALLSMPKVRWKQEGWDNKQPQRNLWKFAQQTLGLKVYDGQDYDELKDGVVTGTDGQLFLQDLWPEPFRSQYLKEESKAPPSRKRLAKIAVARIEHLIHTGE